jgi:hypothetical protein
MHPSWSEKALQAKVPYKNWMDFFASIVVFNVYATKLTFSKATMRMWQGNYGGGAGGEIEFFDKNDKIIMGSKLKELSGITNIQMQVFSYGEELITEDNELTGWANSYNPFLKLPPFLTYLVGTISFENSDKAKEFANDVGNSVGARGQGENYFWNGPNKINITVDDNKVIIQWANPNLKE